MRLAGVSPLRPLGFAGGAFLGALALAGPCGADVYVRPLAQGAWSKFDRGTVTLDLPPGIAVRPGTAEFRMTSRNTGRTRNERAFVLRPVGPPVALPGGGTRVTLSPGKEQGAEMMAFLGEGGRLNRLRLQPGGVSITPSFKLCRTRSLAGLESAVVTGKVRVDLLPDVPPADIDLGAGARRAGRTLDQHVEPC